MASPAGRRPPTAGHGRATAPFRPGHAVGDSSGVFVATKPEEVESAAVALRKSMWPAELDALVGLQVLENVCGKCSPFLSWV